MPKCKKCVAEIVWLKTKKGKNIPCDPETVPAGADLYDKAVMTCHFDTCAAGSNGKTAPNDNRWPPKEEPREEELPAIDLDSREDDNDDDHDLGF